MLLGLLHSFIMFAAAAAHVSDGASSRARAKIEAIRDKTRDSTIRAEAIEKVLLQSETKHSASQGGAWAASTLSSRRPAPESSEQVFVLNELRSQVTRFQPLRPLSRDLMTGSSVWKSRGLDEVPLDFDPSLAPAQCWRTKKEAYCLPSFFILGSPKCGTTTLWEAIGTHPEIIRVRKEPHWWTLGKGQIVPSYVRANYGDAV